ncbi:hypothetical protein PHYPO_G00102730 [Pangasianodon hypophthalmus]|uniref:Uncharacterized protein n=1 Tax=Pangasianodon hypophthalmus TaxID=310915 RepID=A0A5N5PWQ4_PANHP|nr:hypothetical protein PHYPO_G00102730 [Pangasianodon hypophthalmus]
MEFPRPKEASAQAGRTDGAKGEEVGKCLKISLVPSTVFTTAALEAKGCPKGCASSRLCFATRLTSSKLRKHRGDCESSERSFQS